MASAGSLPPDLGTVVFRRDRQGNILLQISNQGKGPVLLGAEEVVAANFGFGGAIGHSQKPGKEEVSISIV